jgi:hypothetical protein
MIGATLLGAFSTATLAGPRSPSVSPPPATVVMIPLVLTRRMRLLPVSAIRNEPSGKGGDVARGVERSPGGGVPVAPKARPAVSGDRGDHAGRADAADAVVAGVGDEEAAVGGGGDAARTVQSHRGVRRGQRVAREPARRVSGTGTGDRADGARVVDAPDPVVGGVGDQVRRGAADEGHVRRGRQLRSGGATPVAR